MSSAYLANVSDEYSQLHDEAGLERNSTAIDARLGARDVEEERRITHVRCERRRVSCKEGT